MSTTTTLSTVLPCPVWCTLPAGHEDDFPEHDGTTNRRHVAHTEAYSPTGYRSEVVVTVEAWEVTTPGGVAELGALAVEVHGSDAYTAEQAQGLAAVLQRAASRVIVLSAS